MRLIRTECLLLWWPGKSNQSTGITNSMIDYGNVLCVLIRGHRTTRHFKRAELSESICHHFMSMRNNPRSAYGKRLATMIHSENTILTLKLPSTAALNLRSFLIKSMVANSLFFVNAKVNNTFSHPFTVERDGDSLSGVMIQIHFDLVRQWLSALVVSKVVHFIRRLADQPLSFLQTKTAVKTAEYHIQPDILSAMVSLNRIFGRHSTTTSRWRRADSWSTWHLTQPTSIIWSHTWEFVSPVNVPGKTSKSSPMSVSGMSFKSPILCHIYWSILSWLSGGSTPTRSLTSLEWQISSAQKYQLDCRSHRLRRWWRVHWDSSRSESCHVRTVHMKLLR